MTDNGSAYRTKAFRDSLRAGLQAHAHRPYTPRTNGKAERFIQTSLREWAYAQRLPASDRATAAMPPLAPPLQLAPTACRTERTNFQSANSSLPSTTC